MLFMNGGIGNGLILAPLLAKLERARPQLKYFAAHNMALESEWIRNALGLRGPAGTFPALWRRFRQADRDVVRNFIESNSVDLILNLRKESAAADTDYFSFRNDIEEHGIQCWDLHEVVAAAGRLPIAEQAATVLRWHGVPVELQNPAWLSRYRSARPGMVGLYVGASTPVKRWPVRDWAAVVSGLRSRGFGVELAAGLVPAERELADSLRQVAGGHLSDVRPESLEDLRDWVAGLDLLVTNDTVTVHLAAALGCPVVVLYLATDGAIWSPVAAPGRLAIAQSPLALLCPLMKPDGTCSRYYDGCPAPCAEGVQPAHVLFAVQALSRGTSAHVHLAGGATIVGITPHPVSAANDPVEIR